MLAHISFQLTGQFSYLEKRNSQSRNNNSNKSGGDEFSTSEPKLCMKLLLQRNFTRMNIEKKGTELNVVKFHDAGSF